MFDNITITAEADSISYSYYDIIDDRIYEETYILSDHTTYSVAI
jgi:hypothetical protein